jgi:hypothetical protein
MQVRESDRADWSPLDRLLGRSDPAALDYLATCLVRQREIRPEEAPSLSRQEEVQLADVEG